MQQNNVLSTNDILTWVIKIFGIIGMIFIGISLALPWASFNLFGNGLNLSPWGAGSFGNAGAFVGTASSALDDVFYLKAMQSGTTEGLLGGVFYILLFVFIIITLVISIKAFKSIGSGIINKTYLIAGIFGIVTIVMCVIGTSQIDSFARVLAGAQGAAIPGGFGYTWGFILVLITSIFFFVNYGLDYFMLQSGMSLQQPIGGQQQSQVMYTSQQPQQQPVQQPPQQPPTQQPPVEQTPPPVVPVKQPPQPTTPKPKKSEPKPPTFCNNCGAQLQAGVKFCNECGAKI